MGGYPGGLQIITWQCKSIQIPGGSSLGIHNPPAAESDGHYDPSTYCLDEDDLIDDLNILWVARQLCPQEPTKSAITALPTLPQEQTTYCSVWVIPRLLHPD